jgi:hypothetical protein
MPSRNFVREIKADKIKDLNPSDIIYLAMKDGSIILVADNDEDTFDYDDVRLDSIDNIKRKSYANLYNIKYYKNKTQKKTLSTLATDYDKNTKNKYSNLSTDRNRATSNSFDRSQNKPIIISQKNKNEKVSCYRHRNEKDIFDQSYNSEFSKIIPNMNHYIKNEKLEKSFDNIKHIERTENNFFHKIEHTNKDNFSFYSSKNEKKAYQRPKSTKANKESNCLCDKKLIIKERTNFNNSYSMNKTPARKNNKEFMYNNNTNGKNNNSLINISNISLKDDSNIGNRTQYLQKRNIYKDYLNGQENYRKINVFKSGKPTRSQSSSNNMPQTPKAYYVKRKEMQIMGRIVNNDNSYRLIDHKHPNTLFEEKCPFCQNLARKNKLCLSHIKEESIYDNHAFAASFGGSSNKRGKSMNTTANNYYTAL